jgi:hypothetical protein
LVDGRWAGTPRKAFPLICIGPLGIMKPSDERPAGKNPATLIVIIYNIKMESVRMCRLREVEKGRVKDSLRSMGRP